MKHHRISMARLQTILPTLFTIPLATIAIIATILIISPLHQTAEACVGKTLVVGSAGTQEQIILAEILSLLITERTGTSIKVVKLNSSEEAHEALLADEIDMYVEYTGFAQMQILKGHAIVDAEELYSVVKKRYQKELNLIWLKPLGFTDKTSNLDGVPVQAATIIRKDVLKKFPALQRLLDKLAGQIDNEIIVDLVSKTKKTPVQAVAKAFLKKKRFI